MRILVVGATGTIGREIVHALKSGHEVISATRRSGVRVDISDPVSIKKMYREVGTVDAVVAAGGEAAFGPLEQLRDADFELSLRSKLMGQVNVVRFGIGAMSDAGSFTLTSGVLAQYPMPGSAALSLVNAGLEGFVRAAALDLPRAIRINVVSPGWVAETLAAMGRDASQGTPASEVAKAYLKSVDGKMTGAVLPADAG